MVTIPELWQPILVATVLTFLAGFVLHMLLPLHQRDWSKLPDEAATVEQLRRSAIPPGSYLFPCPDSPRDLNTPAFLAKMEQGPVGLLILRPGGRPQLGPSLAKMILYHLVLSIGVGYVAGRTLMPGVEYLRVFQVVGATAVLGYSCAVVPFGIWYRPGRRLTVTQIVDGIVWGLLTAGAFGWLWPR